MSKRDLALQAIDVRGASDLEAGRLPREEWLHKRIAVDRRRLRERNSRILLNWLKAEDKEACVQLEADRWGIRPADVRNAIEKMQVDGSVVARLAAEVRVLRESKIVEILQAFQGHRDELYGQLDELEAARADGQTWYEIEVVDESEKLKTKKVRVNTQIANVNRDIMRSFKEESEALSQYMTKPNEVQDHRHLHVHAATEEFQQVFNNLGGKTKEVDPDE